MKVKIKVEKEQLADLLKMRCDYRLSNQHRATLIRITDQLVDKMSPYPELPKIFGTTATDDCGRTYLCAPFAGARGNPDTAPIWLDDLGERHPTRDVACRPGIRVTRVGDGNMPSKVC